MSRDKQKKHDEFESVEHALTTSEVFIEKYQKQILIGVAIVVLAVLAVLAFRNFYTAPREKAAQNEMYLAQSYFDQNDFKTALDGNGSDVIGFKGIISEYGITSSADLAAAYAGICYYKLGEYDNAIKHLSQFSGKDNYLTTSTIGLIGDAYVELDKPADALKFFEKAADKKNDVLSPVYLKKAGLLCESTNQLDKAEKYYTKIKNDYPRSQEASDIEKYIYRVKVKK